jgi:tRNA nucleotidyltransferase (CCA-adding enzyme)
MQELENVYLVGGAVRDQLLGLVSHDKDYVVVGSSVHEMESLGFMSVGKDFPVFLHPKTKQEYALARTERKIGKGYTGFSVDASKSVSLEDDLARRDLTINAMAMDTQGNIIDPFDGQTDLRNKVLRHTTDAFKEDPVRVLRIARFLARYGDEWRIHEDTLALIQTIKEAGELEHLVPERVWKETEKALSEKHPQLYFETLCGLRIFPEIEAMQGIEQPSDHHPEGDVFVHTMLVLKRAADLNFDLSTRFAALTHDFGKPVSFTKYGKLHGHEAEGVPVIEAFCERWRVPNKLKDLAKLTSDNHLRSHKLFEMLPRKIHAMIIERFNAVKQPERFLQFLQACQCDAQGRGETKVNIPYKQAELGRFLLQGLQALDTKRIVAVAIKNGKQGPDLGEAVRVAQIAEIKQLLGVFDTPK